MAVQVHLGTPAPSTSNISQRAQTTDVVPGGEDDLEPDYQELKGPTTGRTHPISALAMEPSSTSRASPQSSSRTSPQSSPPAGRKPQDSLPQRYSSTDPTTGEPMYNEVSCLNILLMTLPLLLVCTFRYLSVGAIMPVPEGEQGNGLWNECLVYCDTIRGWDSSLELVSIVSVKSLVVVLGLAVIVVALVGRVCFCVLLVTHLSSLAVRIIS